MSRWLLPLCAVTAMVVCIVVLPGPWSEGVLGADGTWGVPASGDWSNSGNWQDGTVADGSGDTAWFNAVEVPSGGIEVTLDTPRTIGNLRFGDASASPTGSWILAGDHTLALAGATPTITVEGLGAGATATISTVMGGSDGLTKAGAGTLVFLRDRHTYLGPTVVAEGTLRLASILPPLDGALYWLDATDSSTVVRDANNNVSQWTDKTGNNRNFTQGTAAQQPQYVEGAIGGLNAVSFDGAKHPDNDRLVMSQSTDPRTVFIVNQTVTNPKSLAGIWGRSGDDFGIRWRGTGWEGVNSNDWSWVEGYDPKSYINGTPGYYAAPGTPHVLTQIRPTTSTLSATAIGDYWNHATHDRPYGGTIGEILVYDSALSESQRQQVEQYLMTKWLGTGVVGRLPSNTALTIAAGAAFDLNGYDQTVGSLANHGGSGGSVLLGGATLTTGGDHSSTGFSGTISGGGRLVKTGDGTFTLTGPNTYSGGSVLPPSSGTLAATVNATQNALGIGSIAIGAGSTVQWNNTNTSGDPVAVTIANPTTGTGRLVVNFATGGSNTNTYITGLSDFEGTIELTKADAGATRDKWNIHNLGTIPASLIVGSGTQIFLGSGNTTFTGGITISGVGNAEGRGAVRLGGTLGGTMTLAGDTTIGQEGGTIAGNIASGAAGTQTLTFAGAVVGNSTASGNISDGAGTIAVTQNRAGGTLTLTGNNTYSGTTTISAGTLRIGNGGTTGTLGSGNVVNNGMLVLNRSNDLTVFNRISGSGSLTKQGAGIVTLIGTNTYGGSTEIEAGTLRLVGPPSQNPVTAGLTWSLDASDAASINAGSPANGDPVSSWAATAAGPTVSQTDPARQPTFHTGVQNGLSVVRFTGTNNSRLFSGTDYVDARTLFIVNSPDSLKGLAGIVGGTGEGGTSSDKGIRRDPTGGNAWRHPGDGNDFTNPAGSQMWINDVETNSFAGLGFHLLTATRNSAPMRLNAVGSYYSDREFRGDVGEILAFDRVLTLEEIAAVERYLNWKWFDKSDVLPANTAVAIDAGGQLELFDIIQRIGSLTGAAGSSVLLDNSVLTVGGANTSTTFAGGISGTGGLTKVGSGTLTLSGTGDYTGATNVNEGELLVTGSLGNTAVAVNDGGMLGGTGSIGGKVTVNHNGWLTPGMSPGVLTVGELELNAGSTTFMEIDGLLRGTEYDGVDIIVEDGLAYGGTLSLAFNQAGPFPAGSVFDLFHFTGDASGNFDSVISSGYYAGEWERDNIDTFALAAGWQTLLFSHATGNLTIVPEPSAFALIALTLAALGLCRSARRSRCPA